jgi:uncharacterized membrane protein YdjX (TVP38/TMEM64 family)
MFLKRIAIWIMLICVAIGVAIGGRFLLHWAPGLREWLSSLLAATERLGVAGWAIMVLAQTALAVCGLLPASMLGLAAGTIYGPALGFALSSAGVLSGAMLAFLISRSLFRPQVERLLRRRRGWRDLDSVIAADGWKLACLLRASPVMPFAITSYALGLSSITLRDYWFGTVAALPALFGYVVTGALTRAELSATSDGELIRDILLAIGGIATVLLTLRIGSIARRLMASPHPADGAAEASS